MKVESFKDLSRILALCRKHGVSEMTIDGVSFKLTDVVPVKTRRAKLSTANADAVDMPDQLTEEQLMFGSSDPSVWLPKASQ